MAQEEEVSSRGWSRGPPAPLEGRPYSTCAPSIVCVPQHVCSRHRGLCVFSRRAHLCAPCHAPPLPLPCSPTHRYEMGRQAANTKLSTNVAVRKVRVRGGNEKFRALRLDNGNFAWGTEVGCSWVPAAGLAQAKGVCACAQPLHTHHAAVAGAAGVATVACLQQGLQQTRPSPGLLLRTTPVCAGPLLLPTHSQPSHARRP